MGERCDIATGRKVNGMIYCYEVVRENVVNGQRSGQPEAYYSSRPLEIGRLYLHLRDLKGAYKVLEELEVVEE